MWSGIKEWSFSIGKFHYLRADVLLHRIKKGKLGQGAQVVIPRYLKSMDT